MFEYQKKQNKPTISDIAREAGVPVAALDPVASGPDDAPSDYYFKTMRANLDALAATLVRKGK